MDIKDRIEAGENLVTDEEGNVCEAESIVEEGTSGTLNAVADGCLVSYVNCGTKKKEVVSLRSGDTFHYRDWNGRKCVSKTYRCP